MCECTEIACDAQSDCSDRQLTPGQRCPSVNSAAEYLLLNPDLGMAEAAPGAPASPPALERAPDVEERMHTSYGGSDTDYPVLGARAARAVTGKVLQPQAKRSAPTELLEYHPPSYSEGTLLAIVRGRWGLEGTRAADAMASGGCIAALTAVQP